MVEEGRRLRGLIGSAETRKQGNEETRKRGNEETRIERKRGNEETRKRGNEETRKYIIIDQRVVTVNGIMPGLKKKGVGVKISNVIMWIYIAA